MTLGYPSVNILNIMYNYIYYISILILPQALYFMKGGIGNFNVFDLHIPLSWERLLLSIIAIVISFLINKKKQTIKENEG